MKKNKVLSDLSFLIDDIKNGSATVISYEYKFGEETDADYGQATYNSENEVITIEYRRPNV